MKRLIIALVPAGIALPLKVGNIISWSMQQGYNRHHFGCFDIENTKEALQIYNQAVAGVARAGAADTSPFSARAIEQFVQDHHVDYSTHQPHFFSNVCAPLSGGQKYKVAQTFDWPNFGQLVCLEVTETFNVGEARCTLRTRRPCLLVDDLEHPTNSVTPVNCIGWP
jgi:hypothetical protein